MTTNLPTYFEQVSLRIAKRVAQAEVNSARPCEACREVQACPEESQYARGQKMSGFDVFEMLQDGQVMWHRVTPQFADAEVLAAEQAAKTKNAFFILDQRTRRQVFFYADGSQSEGTLPPQLHPDASDSAV